MSTLSSFFEAIPPETLIIWGAALQVFVISVIIWRGLVVGNPMTGRAKSVITRQNDLRAGLLRPRRRTERKMTTISLMGQVVERFNLLKSREADKMSEKLAGAGWRSKDALVVFLFFKVALPVVGGGLSIVCFYVLQIGDFQPLVRAILALGVTTLGAYAPEIYVKNTRQKRQKAIQKALPDTLDLMVICAEAGLSLDMALNRVAREMSKAAPEIADELALAAVELGFLPERREALENLNNRVDLPAMRGFINTLLQTEKYGTPLSQSLRVLASEFRTERLLKAEEKAAKLPVILTVPMIVFILPTLFIVLMAPAVIGAIDDLSATGILN